MADLKLSARQIELMIAVVQHLDTSKTSIDWASVALAANFTTAKYARDTWLAVKKTLAKNAAPNANGDADARQKGLKRAHEDDDVVDGARDDNAKPARKKATPKKISRKPKNRQAYVEDEDDCPIQPDQENDSEVPDFD